MAPGDSDIPTYTFLPTRRSFYWVLLNSARLRVSALNPFIRVRHGSATVTRINHPARIITAQLLMLAAMGMRINNTAAAAAAAN